MKTFRSSLVLTLIVLAALLATAGLIAAQDDEQPITLHILTQGDSWDPNNIYLEILEEELNLNLEFRQVPQPNHAEVRNVTMASGDYPDVIRVFPTERVYHEYIDGGLLLPLNDLLDQFPAVRDAYPPEVWEANRHSDGNIYHIPRITGVYPVTIAYRKDWTDALGIEEPQTVDEFTEMLRAFQENDPGELGASMIPFVPNRLDDILWIDPIMSPFGVNYMTWVPSPDDADQLVLSHTLPSFKDALRYARSLYEEGLLDQTWGVSTERGLFKFYAGIVGATTDWPQFNHLRLEAIQNAFPDADPEIGYITGLRGPDGIQGGPQITPNAQSLGTALTIAASPEQAEAFFRMINWQYTDGWETMTLGIEGVTYDIVDGRPIRRGRDEVQDENPRYDLYMLDRVFFTEPPAFFDYVRENATWNDVDDDMFAYVTSVLQEVHDETRQLNYLMNREDERITDNVLAIQSVVDEFVVSAILRPGLDIDEAFEEFLVELEQNGLSDMTSAVNELNDVAEINALFGG
jgi:putative aldouronate transport system substrate-binding protein